VTLTAPAELSARGQAASCLLLGGGGEEPGPVGDVPGGADDPLGVGLVKASEAPALNRDGS